MNARSAALILGLAYVGLGAAGLMPGSLAGLLPSTPALAILHLVIGAWGLLAFQGWSRARSFTRGTAFLFAILALIGMLHGAEGLLGLGNAVWLHLASAALAGFVAWNPESGERRGLAGDRRRGSRIAIRNERRQGFYDRRRSPYFAQ